jgi:hypothetical protein
MSGYGMTGAVAKRPPSWPPSNPFCEGVSHVENHCRLVAGVFRHGSRVGGAPRPHSPLEDRLRDHEEALKLVAQELRHTRELEAAEREKQLLRLEQIPALSQNIG